MAVPNDKKLESALRDTVRSIYDSPERDDLTVNLVRKRVEQQFNLKDGFFVKGKWKERSKIIIKEYAVSATRLGALPFPNLHVPEYSLLLRTNYSRTELRPSQSRHRSRLR